MASSSRDATSIRPRDSIGDSIAMSERLNSAQPSETPLKEPSVKIRPPSSQSNKTPPTPSARETARSRRFWGILISLTVLAFSASTETTIIINALPSIVATFGGGTAFLWVPNAYYLASVATIPLYANLSDVFGRRHLLLAAVALFIIGCGVCGGSNSVGMLIAGRTIQGLGAGGMSTVTETVITDLVPLRERSKYLAIVLVGTTVGCSIGPFLGGAIVVSLGWRWIFWLIVILCAPSLGLLVVFLKVQHRRNQTLMEKLRRIDFGGNAIFVGSIIAVLLALTWGGPVYDWDNYRIVIPLVLGSVGLVAFTAFEWTPWLAREPSFPRALISNRTSAAALFMALLVNIVTMWVYYFLPIYFQAIRGKSPLQSGIAILPATATVVPFAMIGGILLSQFGKYKPIHAFCWAVLTLGVGLCSLLDQHSSTAAWVCYQLICAVGFGPVTTTLLPVMQAPLEEKYVATSTGLYSVAVCFGSILGVTIPSVIFTNEVRAQAGAISDPSISAQFANGQAYELATKAFLDSINDPVIRDQVIEIFTSAIRTVWHIGVGFAGVGFLVVFLQKHVELRKENNTEFGLEGDAVARPAEEIQLESLPSEPRAQR